MKYFLPLACIFFLFSCASDDESITVPAAIRFEVFANLEGVNLDQATGFYGDNVGQALYVASRQPDPVTGILGENVKKYDMDGNILAESNFEINDFITKTLHIVDDELLVLGGSFLNVYDLDLNTPPTSFQHGLSISRFGSAVYQNQLYFWGGDLNELFSDVIWKWDGDARTIQGIAQLPGPKAYAQGEVFEDRLFIFGGREQFLDFRPQRDIYVYQFTDTTAATFELPDRIARSFTATYRDLIFVAGQRTTADNDPDTDDLNIVFGVYNPRVFDFQEIPTNLSDAGNLTIHQMTTVGNKLFIIYGEADRFGGGLQILSADL